jgi:hypothetical protein
MSSSRIGSRIAMTSHGSRWVATVSSAIPAWQRQSLELWFGAWMALGAMLGYGVWAFPGDERTFYLICLAFWGFFAFRAWRAVRWRRSGFEVIQLSPEGLELRLDHGQKAGRSCLYAVGDVSTATVPEPNPRSFLESMEQQFWVVGGDRIHVQIAGKTHVFGKQLDLRDAQQLAYAFNKRLEKLQRQEG